MTFNIHHSTTGRLNYIRRNDAGWALSVGLDAFLRIHFPVDVGRRIRKMSRFVYLATKGMPTANELAGPGVEKSHCDGSGYVLLLPVHIVI